MTDSPKPATSYIDEAVIRQSLRMKAALLELLSLTVGAHNVNNEDFMLMAAIDKHCQKIPTRYRQNSISGNPPMVREGTGERFHEEHPERDEPLGNIGAEAFAAGMAEQLGNQPPSNTFDLTGAAPATRAPAAEPLAAATAVPAPPPPAAPTTDAIPEEPAGEVNEEIARGLAEIAPETEDDGPTFDGNGVRNRGHVRLR